MGNVAVRDCRALLQALCELALASAQLYQRVRHRGQGTAQIFGGLTPHLAGVFNRVNCIFVHVSLLAVSCAQSAMRSTVISSAGKPNCWARRLIAHGLT